MLAQLFPALGNELLADAEGIDEPTIAVDVLRLQVVEEPAPLDDQLEEAAARVMVLRVDLEVLGQVRDALGQQRDLHFRRAGVALVLCEFLNGFGLPGSGEAHLSLSLSDKIFDAEECLRHPRLSTRS